MDSSYTRTGLSVLSNDGSDAVSAYRTSIRNLAAWAEANAALRGQGLLSARPAAGKAGTFYKATDAATGILHYDNGTTWETIGAAPPTDGSAATPSLRTLGSGATQAAAGNHTHPTAGVTAQYAYKTTDTGRSALATLTSDPHLAVTLDTGVWMVDIDLVASGTDTGDIRVGWIFSGSAAVRQTWALGPALATTNPANTGANLQTTQGSSSGWAFGVYLSNDSAARIRTVLAVSSAGTFTVQWSQNVSDSGTTYVRAGSHVVALGIA